MLRHFQLPYLGSEGYVNIRCAWSLGCPAEIKPLAEEGEHREAVHAGGAYKQAFQHLFPGQEVPESVGVSCCAQFAATGDKIRERERSEYVRYRKWIMETELGDSISGRVMEYSWHSKFSLRCTLLLSTQLLASTSKAPPRGIRLTCDSDLWKASGALPLRKRLLLQRLWPLRSSMRRRGKL
jgi:hypothetical protein